MMIWLIAIVPLVFLLLWLESRTGRGQRRDATFREWEVEDEMKRHEARMRELL